MMIRRGRRLGARDTASRSPATQAENQLLQSSSPVDVAPRLRSASVSDTIDAWTIFDGPEEVDAHGYDATLWRWRLRHERTGLTADVVVKVSGTAMAMDQANLPPVTRDARNTAGKSEVSRVLTWWEPPHIIELHSASQAANHAGGSRMRPQGRSSEAERKILEIEARLAERGAILRLQEDPEHDRWVAMIIPAVLRVGATDYVLGKTRLEAAEGALILHENYPAEFMGGNPQTSQPPTASASGIGGAVADALSGAEEDRRKLEEVAADFGWRIAFAAEPDGAWFWLVIDAATDEVLKGAVAPSWDDALLAVIEHLTPPSGER
jgi:hypothetical protein